MATFEITRIQTFGISRYTVKAIKDVDTHIINHSCRCYCGYLNKRIPKFLSDTVSTESLQEYFDVKFMFKCKYGNVKITVGRLLYFTFMVYRINRGGNDKVSEEKLSDIIDWLVIHEPKIVPSVTSIPILLKIVNPLFHDCAAFEREIFDLIINKRLKKPKNKLEEIVLYTNCKVPDMYLDSHYYCTTIENAKYVVKWIIGPEGYGGFITPDYFKNDELLGNMSLNVDAIKRSLLLDYFIEQAWDKDLAFFNNIIYAHSLREIKLSIDNELDFLFREMQEKLIMNELLKLNDSELENFIKNDTRSDKDKFAWLDQNKNIQEVDEDGFLRVVNTFLATMEHRYQRLKFMLFDISPKIEEPQQHDYSRKNNPHALLVSPFRVELPSGCNVTIDTGKKPSIKNGYFARIAPISELGYGFSIVPLEAVYYRPLKETVKVKLFNHGDTDYEIREGDPIAMLIEYPFENFEESFNPWG